MKIIEVDYNWRGGLANRTETEYIALHHAEATRCSAQDIHSWHLANGWSGIGYHFFVRKDGSVYRGRPIWAVGAHVLGMNGCSVGICAEGDYHSRDKSMPEVQKRAIMELIEYIKKNHYPNAKVVGHCEIGDSNCPGQYYPLKEIKAGKGAAAVAGFKDTKGHYAEKHINELKDMGVVNGDENGNFRPNDTVTRADAAIMVRNAIRYVMGK